MTEQTESNDRRQRDKPTLFCPACGHRSHIADEWIESWVGSVRALSCPECGETVDERHGRTTRPPAEAD